MHLSQVEQRNHEIIEQFISLTKDDGSYITNCVKATIAQFLLNIRDELKKVADPKGRVNPEILLQKQIDVLRECIVDLQGCFNRRVEGVKIQ